MFVRTGGAKGAVSFAESFADGAGGVEPEAVFAVEEVREGEVVIREGGNLVDKSHGSRGTIVCSDGHDGYSTREKKAWWYIGAIMM